jgi:hypothetical protein
MSTHKIKLIIGDGQFYPRVVCPPDGGCALPSSCGGCGRDLLDPEHDPSEPDSECYDCRGVKPADVKGCALALFDDLSECIEGEIVVDTDVVWTPDGPEVTITGPLRETPTAAEPTLKDGPVHPPVEGEASDERDQ